MNKISLSKLTRIKTGKLDANASVPDGKYPFFTCAKDSLRINEYAYDCECVLVAGNGDLNAKYYSGKFNAYQRTYIIESTNKNVLNTKYLYYFLEKHLTTLRRESIGGVIKYIKLQNLENAEILLPSLSEQENIVNALDTASNIYKNINYTLTRFEELSQSIFVDMFGNQFTKQQHNIKLGECLQSIENGWSPICDNKPRMSENDWAILTLGAISSRRYIETKNKLLPKETAIVKKIEVRRNNLLFSRKNTPELVGATAYVFNSQPRLLIPDTIFRLNYNPDIINGIYLAYLLNNLNFRKKVQALAGGSAGSMPNISIQKLKNLLIPLPGLDLQNKFANYIEFIEIQKYRKFENVSNASRLFNILLNSTLSPKLL